jgi:hypothetical protein
MPLKTHILRLGSVVPHGVGGPEAGIIDLIYAFLLREYGQNAYSYIHVNQIGEDLDEVIIKDGKKIYINVRYPAIEGLEQRSTKERNRIRLDVAHMALLRIAEYEMKLDAIKLQAIRQRILDDNFSFGFVYRSFVNKSLPDFTAKVMVNPQIDRFNFFVQIEQDGKVVCSLPIYQGKTTDWYFSMFSKGKWKGRTEFLIKNSEIEVRIQVDQCRLEIINLTPYENPPNFQMMQAVLSPEKQEQSYNDWIRSLPPAMASIITTNLN